MFRSKDGNNCEASDEILINEVFFLKPLAIISGLAFKVCLVISFKLLGNFSLFSGKESL